MENHLLCILGCLWDIEDNIVELTMRNRLYERHFERANPSADIDKRRSEIIPREV